MSELRRRMTEDLQVRGLSERTQEAYARAVRKLAEHLRTPPDRLRDPLQRLLAQREALAHRLAPIPREPKLVGRAR